jgi:phage replication initiation protein
MKSYQSEEHLALEGQKVKILCAERAVSAESGVVIDYWRSTFTREKLFRSSIPSRGELIVDGLQLDSEIVFDVAVHFAKILGFKPGEARPGRDYYDHSFTIVNENGHEVASVSGGGESQRGTFCLTIKGEGCTFASKGWERRLYDCLHPLTSKVTRSDLALDCLNGECGYEQAAQAFEAGEFSYRGRAPTKMCIRGDDVEPGKPGSTTFQVGKRESGKIFRGYDKGHQFKLMDDKWWRAEVELRSSNRIIPLEVLIRPAAFFAGAYGFTAKILEQVKPQSIPTCQKVAEASVERTIRWFERTVAPSLVHISIPAGVEWLTQLIVDQAHRPLPKSLQGLSAASLMAGIEKAFPRFTPTPSVPAGLVAT